MPLLAAEALGLGDGDAADAHFVQRLLHLVELERFDNRLDLLHACLPLGLVAPVAVRAGSGVPGPVPVESVRCAAILHQSRAVPIAESDRKSTRLNSSH